MVPCNPRRRTHPHQRPRAGRPSAGRRLLGEQPHQDCTCATLLMGLEMHWFGLTQITRPFSWRRRGPKGRIRWKRLVDELRRAIGARRPRGTGGLY